MLKEYERILELETKLAKEETKIKTALEIIEDMEKDNESAGFGASLDFLKKILKEKV